MEKAHLANELQTSAILKKNLFVYRFNIAMRLSQLFVVTSKRHCLITILASITHLAGLALIVGRFGLMNEKKEVLDFVVMAPPVIEDALPHLKHTKEGLKPALWLSQNPRTNVSFVFALNTVKRKKNNYLTQTLESLFANIPAEDAKDCLVIVMIGEPFDESAIHNISAELQSKFSEQLDSGMLEVIAPPASFYPDMSNLPRTYSDPPDRVYWRSKQNLDYAYLMMFARSRSKYYLHLEDDVVVAKPNFLQSIKKAIAEEANNLWFYMSFCGFGSVAKMFKSAELPAFINNLLTYYKFNPADLIMFDVAHQMICPNSGKSKCRTLEKPPLFAHTGERLIIAWKETTASLLVKLHCSTNKKKTVAAMVTFENFIFRVFEIISCIYNMTLNLLFLKMKCRKLLLQYLGCLLLFTPTSFNYKFCIENKGQTKGCQADLSKHFCVKGRRIKI